MKENDVNVFIVDWGDGAMNKDYLTAVFNMRITAQSLANFIKFSGLDALNVHCIGHSLGAHACGFAGKAKKIGRITGTLSINKIQIKKIMKFFQITSKA